MEIPNYLYVLLFSIMMCFVAYVILPPPVNYVSAPLSNFTNVNKTILYTVDSPDNITKALYYYGSVSKTALALGISKESVIKQLAASKSFSLGCMFIKPRHFGDPFNNTLECNVFGEKYIYKPKVS